MPNELMKKILPLLAIILLLSSCANTWNENDKDAFFQACMDDATTWAGDPAKAKTYCECVTIKVMEKYPNVNDAVEQIEVISKDPDIQACKIPILK
jgi:hypothetical protein